MSGASHRPTSGTRYVLEQVRPGLLDDRSGAGPELVYRGFVHLPDADLPVEVRVELPGGATRATLAVPKGMEASPEHKELERMAAAFIRSATKPGAATGGPFPRKIVRWRPSIEGP